MSWTGMHPKISQAEGRRISKPGSCRICIYRNRVWPEEAKLQGTFFKDHRYQFVFNDTRCSRCGNNPGRRIGVSSPGPQHPLPG